MRTIKNKFNAVYAPIDDLITYRAMPTGAIQHLDPFLFINHHGPQVYPPDNNGLPFGPHPHRGFETLTYIFKGDIMHWDSSGAKSVIKEGGVQWMTAGSGLIHSEISSDEFKAKGGEEEVIQLWLNLPASHKMTPPTYKGLHAEELKHIDLDNGNGQLHLISGNFEGESGPIDSIANLTMTYIDLKQGATINLEVPKSHQVLFYMVKGNIEVNNHTAETHQMVVFDQDDENIKINALTDCRIIFGHGLPFNEPIVAQGPFVMNSEEEIYQAYHDYQSGKMGSWQG